MLAALVVFCLTRLVRLKRSETLQLSTWRLSRQPSKPGRGHNTPQPAAPPSSWSSYFPGELNSLKCWSDSSSISECQSDPRTLEELPQDLKASLAATLDLLVLLIPMEVPHQATPALPGPASHHTTDLLDMEVMEDMADIADTR